MRALLIFAALSAHAETLRYWVEPCPRETVACRPGDQELAEWALAAWQAASGGRLALDRVKTKESAQIRINWTGGMAGLYGEARRMMVEGKRGAEVYVVVPSERMADDLMRETVVYLTCVHETGHALGLEHTADFADIMYSFQYGGDITEYFARYRRKLKVRADIRKHAGMSDADRKRFVEMLELTSGPR